MDNSRRNFIGKSVMGAALAISIPDMVSAAIGRHSSTGKIKVNPNDVILFQGDSITDAGRNRDNKDANNTSALGNGYAFLATAKLLHKYPTQQLNIYNKGISGNKVHQLAERWDEDCLQIKPNILSVLIGVNDYWHTLSGGYKGDIQVYKDDYSKLLDNTLKELPNVKLIIGEPFAVNKVKAVTDDWFPTFDTYRQAAHDIAKAYNAAFVPYQSIFDEAAKQVSPAYWTSDGVHTSLAGAQLMAEAWLSQLG